MAKPHITRTLGPIHFEDLDPHRFEDLVRQLAYDFRQWQSIESTGRGGADDGFDIRVRSPPPINYAGRRGHAGGHTSSDGGHPMDDSMQTREGAWPQEGGGHRRGCSERRQPSL